MARYKPAGSKKVKPGGPKRGFIPCVIVLVIGFTLIFLLLYASMSSGK